MTQHTDQGQPSGGLSFRRSLLSVLTLLLLTGLMFLIFQDHLPEIRQAIGRLSPAQLGLLLALALTYPLIEGVISQRVLASRVPGFSFRRGLDLAFLGAFGNVVTFGAGTLPMQGYDISLSGLPAVPGMGLMTLQYVFHKGAVMVYAVLLLALNGRWLLAADAAGMMRYLLPAAPSKGRPIGLWAACPTPASGRPAAKAGPASWTAWPPRAVLCWPTGSCASRCSCCRWSSWP